MTGFSIGVRDMSPHAGRAARLRTLVGGRQTRADIIVATTLLAVSFVATFANGVRALEALPSFGQCAALACTYGPDFDVFAITFVISVVVGTTFGVHAVLKLLNRRIAWGYAFLDAMVSLGCLLGASIWLSAF